MSIKRAVFAAGALVATSVAHAITFTASSGTRAAQAEFTMSGSNLKVVFSNISAFDTVMPIDVLTGVFFNITGTSSLTPISANVSSGSSVYNNATQVMGSGADVGGAWAYKSGINPDVSGATQGISSAGLGIFGDADVFPGADADGAPGVDGIAFGMLSAGDDINTRNGGLSSRALTKNSTTFLLSGVPGNFDLNKINSVAFQYGTDLSEPRLTTPEPCSVIALLGLLALRKRSRKNPL